jgi:hypothetical protein
MKQSLKLEVIENKNEELEAELAKISEDLSTVISEILKKDGAPVFDMTAMDRLAELHRNEIESDNWKKSSYLLSERLQALVAYAKTNVPEGEDIPASIEGAIEASEIFKTMRLGIDKPTE